MGPFSEETLRKMATMARFRNLLVHHYVKVDDARVYEQLGKIDAFEVFLCGLARLVEEG